MAKTGVGSGSRTVRLWLICISPPISTNRELLTEFGLQDRQQALDPGSPQADGSVRYEILLTISRVGETNALRFSGPLAHGTPAVPFLYLSLRYRAEPTAPIKRLKIPLASLTWDMIATAPEEALFTARVSGNGSGTVPLLDGGWIRQDQPQP